MLKKSQRLNLSDPKNRGIFRAQNLTQGNLRAFYRKSQGESFKAAVVVPKKRVPTAALRNEVRRALYDTIQESSLTSLPIEVLILFEGTSEAAKSTIDLKNNASKLMEKIGKST